MASFLVRPLAFTPKFTRIMSTTSLYANLPDSVRDFVAASSKDESHLGQTDAEKKDVTSWISKASDASFASNSTLQSLNADLVSRTYLVGNSITAADTAVYGVLHPIISKLSPQEYYSVPALTRYFDHVQHDPTVRAAPNAPSLVTFDLEGAPKQERKVEAPVKKKKEKAPEAAAGASTEAVPAADKGKKVAAAEETSTATEQPATSSGKKEKKEKAKKEAAPAASGKKGEGSKASGGGAAAADSGDPIPSMIDLRVGHIVDIKVHPDADGLYVEQIDLGEPEGPRTVISGLVNYIPIERMRDRYIVAVCNLKPANMRGIKSHAMVLCATSKEGKEGGIELVEPPAGVKVGERVYFEGYEDKEPVSQLNPKKKIFETIQPGFITLESHEAAWIDPATKSVHRIRTKEGVCMSPSFVGASLS